MIVTTGKLPNSEAKVNNFWRLRAQLSVNALLIFSF